MNYNPIILVAGDPNSIFLEIFFKSLKIKKFNSPIILICSQKLLKLNMRNLNFKMKIKNLNYKSLNNYNLNNSSINLINIEYNNKDFMNKDNAKSNKYINNCFEVAFKLINDGITKKFINGPITKTTFLKKKFLGITEYIASNFSVKKNAMLIYNKKLSVCPITTHLPLKLVSKKINIKLLKEKVNLIENFYINKFKYKPKIAILGLNPHCESIDKFDEDEKILKPAIKYLKKLNYSVSGPLPADTVFLKKNRIKYDVILGMYHDQVLSPFKTLFEYDAINITLGLPFTRISPDHGPNKAMVGLNKSNPTSLIKAITFLDKN